MGQRRYDRVCRRIQGRAAGDAKLDSESYADCQSNAQADRCPDSDADHGSDSDADCGPNSGTRYANSQADSWMAEAVAELDLFRQREGWSLERRILHHAKQPGEQLKISQHHFETATRRFLQDL